MKAEWSVVYFDGAAWQDVGWFPSAKTAENYADLRTNLGLDGYPRGHLAVRIDGRVFVDKEVVVPT